MIPVEIKSSMTMRNEYFDRLLRFQELSKDAAAKNYVIYAGDITEERSSGKMVSWTDFGNFIDTIEVLKN